MLHERLHLNPYKMLRTVEIVAILLLASAQRSCGAKILAIFAAPFHSHATLRSSLLGGLAAKGHNVTAVTPFPETTHLPNYEEILLPGATAVPKRIGVGNFFDIAEDDVLSIILKLTNFTRTTCKFVLSEPAVQNLIHAKDVHFDVIILEALISECFLAFGYKFSAPIVKFSTFGGLVWMFDWVANPNPFAYVPDSYLGYTDKMTLTERIWNVLYGTVFRLVRRFHHLPRVDKLVRQYFNETENFPSIWELEDTTTSLLLLNTDFGTSYPRPLMPNVIQVGGLHVKPPKQLPQDIEKFLDEASHGVVYFSMGTMLKSSNIPESKLKAFLEAFSKMKEKILWKCDKDTLPRQRQPNNVLLRKWLPQSDILAHPNVRAFMTHGGLLSSQEAIDRGVPIVGIPIFFDQRLNVARAKAAGYGILLDFQNISTESVIWALREILDNSTYRENAQRVSRIYRDQPMKPLETAVYWTEYVMRHKGAPHMRSAALDLAWYQHGLLDVMAVFALVIVSIISVMYLVVSTIVRKFRDVIVSIISVMYLVVSTIVRKFRDGTSPNVVNVNRKNK